MSLSGVWHRGPAVQFRTLPAESRHLTRRYSRSGTWQPRISAHWAGDPRGELRGMRAWEVGTSEGRPVMGRIGVRCPTRKRADVRLVSHCEKGCDC